jgi:hypothetical protein
MRRVSVSIFGKDMMTHTVEVDAVILFDAADHAIQEWCRFWRYSPGAFLEVGGGGERWKVSQEKVRDVRGTTRGLR